MTASGGTAPGAADQAGRPRRDGVCASVATHPSSVALAEALPRSRIRRPAARSTCEGLTGERGGPTAPFPQRRHCRDETVHPSPARAGCLPRRRLPLARRRLVGKRRRLAESTRKTSFASSTARSPKPGSAPTAKPCRANSRSAVKRPDHEPDDPAGRPRKARTRHLPADPAPLRRRSASRRAPRRFRAASPASPKRSAARCTQPRNSPAADPDPPGGARVRVEQRSDRTPDQGPPRKRTARAELLHRLGRGTDRPAPDRRHDRTA